MKRSKGLFAVASLMIMILLAGGTEVYAGATFQGVGFLTTNPYDFESEAQGISADGSVVVGYSYNQDGYEEAFRWTAGGDIVGLGTGSDESYGYAASTDGSVIVGQVDGQPFRWTSGSGVVPLGHLAGGVYAKAFSVSGDGSIVVGYDSDSPNYAGYRWTQSTGMQPLGVSGGSSINDISSDGTVYVGYLGNEAFRLTSTDGLVPLRTSTGGYSIALGVSADGSVIVGNMDDQAFRWTQSDGMVGLGFLAGDGSSVANAASGDGSIIVGASSDRDWTAFIWDETNGMRDLKDFLESDYGLDLTGWTLGGAYDISADGLTIVGWGENPQGYSEGWVANLGTGTISTIPVPGSLLLASIGIALVRRRRRDI